MPRAASTATASARPRTATGRSWRWPCRATWSPTSHSSTRASSCATHVWTAEAQGGRHAMLNAIRAGLRSGRVTTTYPEQPEPAPPAYRGRPVINPARCDCSAACADACPSGAISVLPLGPDATGWELDLARCVFCGLCAEACPNDAISISNDFELAVRSRADLITRVTFGSEAAPSIATEPALPVGGQNADQLGERIRALLKRSLHIRHMDAGSDNSTDWELSALLGPVYDLQRLGIDVVASPRHADLLFVTGAVT